MVRFQVDLPAKLEALSKFQFPNGPISSGLSIVGRSANSTFQFPNGPISRRWTACRMVLPTVSFNSPMVRFQVNYQGAGHPGQMVSIPQWSDFKAIFYAVENQASSVSIPQWSDFKQICNAITLSRKGFNSPMVRFQVEHLRTRCNSFAVSIPQWSDFKKSVRTFRSPANSVSIPQWSDFKHQGWRLSCCHACFNSPMVRFQALRPAMAVRSLSRFQFPNGPISSRILWDGFEDFISFNSPMVRFQAVQYKCIKN